MTLIELMVVISILAVTVGLATIAGGPFLSGEEEDERLMGIEDARRTAIQNGVPVEVTIPNGTDALRAVAMPDGSVVADSALGLDRWTGRRDAR